MLLIPVSDVDVSVAQFHQSSFVDFAVWVLIYDGLRVQPFNSHGEGFNDLQALGLNQRSWSLWFRKLVMLQHPGVRLQYWEKAQLIAHKRGSLAYEPLVYDGMAGFEAIEVKNSGHLLERCYDLIETLSKPSALELSMNANRIQELLSNNNSPVSLFEGDAVLIEELEKRWSWYSSKAAYRVHHAFDLERSIVRDTEGIADELNEALKEALSGKETLLSFNFVNYTSQVFALLDSSIVIGLPAMELFSWKEMKTHLIRATEAFVKKTGS